MRLDLKRMALEAGPKPAVHIYHAGGGGVATHVEHEVKKLRQANRKAILIRVGVRDRWSLEISSSSTTAPYCPNLRSLPVNQFRSLLAEFLYWLSPAFVHIHSLAGLDWRSTTGLFDLIRETRAPYYITLHDYAAFCHRNNLVQPSGRYCGLAELDVCRVCVKSDRNYPEAIDPAVRREAFARFLEGAACIFAPSRDIKTRFEAAGVRYAIELRPHDEAPLAAPAYTPPKQPETFNIIVLGAIGRHKGSRIVLALARDAKARDLPIHYRIVGYSDASVEMEAAGVVETGPYAEADEAFAHIVEANPSCIFLPSIWPETYCYTLSMAFALQCPPVVFDIGAQAERVREKGFGVVLPYDLTFNIKALNNRFLEMHDVA